MKNNQRLKDITSIAIVAALYIVLTLAVYPLSYGSPQFRISELLVLLAFFNIKHGYGVTIGVFVANFFNSEFALVDAVVGTLSTFIAVLCINKCKRLFVATLFPTLTSILVVIEISFFVELPWYLVAIEVVGAMFIIESIIGFGIFKILSKNKGFLKLVESKKEGFTYEI